jgi:hypothetical protein
MSDAMVASRCARNALDGLGASVLRTFADWWSRCESTVPANVRGEELGGPIGGASLPVGGDWNPTS